MNTTEVSDGFVDSNGGHPPRTTFSSPHKHHSDSHQNSGALPSEPLLRKTPSYSSSFTAIGEPDEDLSSLNFKRVENDHSFRHDSHIQRRLRIFDSESPQWRSFATHVAMCVATYPVLFILATAANNKDLFTARLLVGAGCILMGISLGGSLLRLSKPILEAATWATLIHQSTMKENAGLPLKDIAAHVEEPSSGLGALKLLWDRKQYPGAARRRRKSYDRRMWSIWILFFLVNVGLSGGVAFILGRVVDIQVDIKPQYKIYREVAVTGDLTPDDSERAKELNKAFDNYALTWTILPGNMHGVLPPAVSLPWTPRPTSPNLPTLGPYIIYFSDVTKSQLMPSWRGFGTFHGLNLNTQNNTSSTGVNVTSAAIGARGNGASLKLPRWGLRMKCEKIRDVIPESESNKTYVFAPRDTLRNLFKYFDTPFPPDLERPINTSQLLRGDNDTLFSSEKMQLFALGGKFFDDGVALSLMSTPISIGQNNFGRIVTIETVLIRLNTTYTEQGKFAVLSDVSTPDENGKPTHIGYDAAVCLQLCEPWIVEIYNSSTGLPSLVQVLDKGVEVQDMDWDKFQEVRQGDPLMEDLGLSRALNSSHLTEAYITTHQDSVNQMLKDNGRGSYYVPSPILVAYTDGQGPYGYTELSAEYYANARGNSDASAILPYFVGSGSIITRKYDNQNLAVVAIFNGYLAILISVVFLIGAISTFVVPTLPLGSPRRGFDLITWVTVFSSQEIVSDRTTGFEKQMQLDDIVQHAGQLRVRYTGDVKGLGAEHMG